MSESTIREFKERREKLNDIVMKYAGTTIKRFYNLDTNAYREGILDRKTKELLGLVASFVLRCDDCIIYHLDRCSEEGVTTRELEEALSIGLLVGGTITIPHLRRAFKTWDDMQQGQDTAGEK